MYNFDIGYRFVDCIQFGHIINDKEIRPTNRPDLPEEKAIFITMDKNAILEIVQPLDYNGQRGFLLTINTNGIDFRAESDFEETEKVENIFSFYTPEKIPMDKIINIEYIPALDMESWNKGIYKYLE